MPRIALSGEPLIDDPTALRPWRDADMEQIVAACQDPEIPRWTRVPSPYGESDARAYLLQRYDLLAAGVAAPFAIVASDDDTTLLGSISLLDINWEHERGEVGYWLAREARGQGHVTRAVKLICAFGFDQLRLARIALLASTRNAASQRVAERAGFIREAVLRSYMRTPEGRQDMVAFALLRDDPGRAT
jgi:RimJ/RimL family protein N-acetyltransferase